MGCCFINATISNEFNKPKINQIITQKVKIEKEINEEFDKNSIRTINDNIKENNFDNKSFNFYFNYKNYISCEAGKEAKGKNKFKKINIIKLNNTKKKKKTFEEKKNNLDNLNMIEDRDIDIRIYKKYITKTKTNENSNDKNETSNKYFEETNEDQILQKSIQERITLYKTKNEEKKYNNEDTICNLGQSYDKDKGE